MNLFFECNVMCFEIKAKFGIRFEFETLNAHFIVNLHIRNIFKFISLLELISHSH